MPDVPHDSPLRRAPQVVDTSLEALPAAEQLATPEVRVLLGYTRRLLRLHDGHTLGILSFSYSGWGNWLFLIDGRDLSVERYDMPYNDVGTHGAALGADGDLHFMPYGNGRVHHFRVATRQFETVTTDVPTTELTWEAIGASNGRIYFGSYPSACFGEYDPVTRRVELWRQIAPNTKYVTDFYEDARGLVHCVAWGPDRVPMVFDPATRELRPEEPPSGPPPSANLEGLTPPEGDVAYLGLATLNGRRFTVSHPSGRLWELDADGNATLCGETGAFAEPYWWLADVEGGIVGISYFGALFRYDPEQKEFRRGHLPNLAAGGNGMMFIETVAQRWAIGAHYSQQNLFKLDLETGALEQAPWPVARTTGEPMCAVGFGDRAYIGVYTKSIMLRYEPAQPFVYGQNPRPLIELGATYKQTRPRAAVTDGRLVYISSDSEYNYLGGALVVIDPATDQVEVYHHLIRDQNLPTLDTDPRTGLVWGGTDRWGQVRSHPPTQESSLIYAFDPEQRKVVATLTLWPGSDVTSVLGVSTEGVLVASSGSEIALVDTTTREVLYQGAFPLALPTRLRRGADGASYFISGGLLYRWDFSANTLTPVARTPGCWDLSEASPGTWVVIDGITLYRVRLNPPGP